MEKKTVIESIKHLGSYDKFDAIERFPVRFFEKSSDGCQTVAQEIAHLILTKADANKNCVLGLATGSAFVSIYRELVRLHKEEGLSFKNVITFNLDEYYPISHDNSQSHHQFMYRNLFSHIDIAEQNINIPSGNLQKQEVEAFCQSYQRRIFKCGGIDLQVLEIGKNGQIGFNELASSKISFTRLISLQTPPKINNSTKSIDKQYSPKQAITMGLKSIKQTKRVILMAWGENKVNIVHQIIEESSSINFYETYLTDHRNLVIYIDRAASTKLSRFSHPWVIQEKVQYPKIHFDQYWTTKAVCWLSEKAKKPILRLTYQDYSNNNLCSLISTVGNQKADFVNQYAHKLIENKLATDKVFQKFIIQKSGLNKQDESRKKRIMIFSPHPDDDVICMGGTIQKLLQQSHQVSIVYMTSGSFSVFDHEAKKYLDFFLDFSFDNKLNEFEKIYKLWKKGNDNIDNKEQGHIDSELVISVKRLIRRSQAKRAASHLGLSKNVYFLDLPFYENGKSKKNPPNEIDLQKIENIICIEKPDYIFAAGDLTDPHGTHKICLDLLLKVTDYLNFKQENILLYRGAWQEWQIELCDIIVPMTPKECEMKKQSIWKHQSQKDKPMYPGDDDRQFWQRAEQRNRGTADLISKLGFTSYEACQCFATLKRIRDVFDLS